MNVQESVIDRTQNGNVAPSALHHNEPIPTCVSSASLSADLLSAALVSPCIREGFSGTYLHQRLPEMLSRWQTLGRPDPRVELGTTFLVEFERFLDRQENQA